VAYESVADETVAAQALSELVPAVRVPGRFSARPSFLLSSNHPLRILHCVPRRTSLIKKHAMLGSLDLVATPQLPDESDHHFSSHNVDEPESLRSTLEPRDGQLAGTVPARDLVTSPWCLRMIVTATAARPDTRTSARTPRLTSQPAR